MKVDERQTRRVKKTHNRIKLIKRKMRVKPKRRRRVLGGWGTGGGGGGGGGGVMGRGGGWWGGWGGGGGSEFVRMPATFCRTPYAVPPATFCRMRHCVACDIDRKSTRLNSSHGYISYAVFCLKKKNRAQPTKLLCIRADKRCFFLFITRQPSIGTYT